ncbi:unnamed protein product [Bursaphelenchus xylophilus]|uniref:(pine wood nematode) hypothetical protein n=1 Tax=Bursaphelenchus xylophilus TaxID=6326 RepID=A0A1I7SSP9_BURXY|nr:unnamed protein product [Bursaphelenchus xylophilus]CAG9108924.1 unnamed protein product [Bursaphelenchus xylophilus]
MASTSNVQHSDESDDEIKSKYIPPAKKELKEILQADAEDESLQKYKQKLLGSFVDNVVVDPSNPNRVIVKTIAILADHGTVGEFSIPLQSDFTLKIKEGERFQLRFEYYVQREIVSGLRYIHRVSRLGIRVAKETYMIGSYGPAAEIKTFLTPWENAPSGMMSRGKYSVTSKITDDDENDYATFNWTLEIGTNW